MDVTVPGLTFDSAGICNFCKVHDKLDETFPLNAAGAKKLERHL